MVLTNNESNEKIYNESKSLALDLESLNNEYKNLLIQYQQAVLNYVNYLKQDDAIPPCNSYSSSSKGISQACYNDIWEKSGCGGGNIGYPNASASWQQSQTLNGLILDSWYWATMTDSYHREGCYAPSNQNYNTTNAPNYNINGQPMVQIQGNQYLGTSTLSQNNSPTVDECQASCASTPGCSGATFNGTNYKQPMCLLRSGDSDVVNGLPDDYAIVPTGKQLLLIVQKINIQLSDINSQIQKKTTSAEPIYDKLNEEKVTENKKLNDQFKKLSVEREKINKMLLEYQTLDETQVEGTIVTNKNYYMYILLSIVSVLVLVLLFKFLATNTTSQNTGYVPQSGGSNIFTRFFNKLF